MATVKQIQEALENLSGSGVINPKKLVKEVVKKNLEGNYPEESLDEVAEKICDDGNSYLYKTAISKLIQLAGSLTTLPVMAVSLVSQFSTIPSTVVGMAAPAAGPMVTGVKSQALALKSQLIQSLQTAAELGIDLPVDPLIEAIKMIKPLL